MNMIPLYIRRAAMSITLTMPIVQICALNEEFFAAFPHDDITTVINTIGESDDIRFKDRIHYFKMNRNRIEDKEEDNEQNSNHDVALKSRMQGEERITQEEHKSAANKNKKIGLLPKIVVGYCGVWLIGYILLNLGKKFDKK